MREKIQAVFLQAMTKDNQNAIRFASASSAERWGYIGWTFLFVVITGVFIWIGQYGLKRWPGMGWYIWIGVSGILCLIGIASLAGHIVMKLKGK